jgi:hypothetical protein
VTFYAIGKKVGVTHKLHDILMAHHMFSMDDAIESFEAHTDTSLMKKCLLDN